VDTVTGLIAVVLLFLAGPYRSLQKREVTTWSGRIGSRRLWGAGRWGGKRVGGKTWGPLNNVFAHANLSMWALLAVGLHVLLSFEIAFGLALVGASLVVVAFLSGLYGLFAAKTPAKRRRWLWFHRRLMLVFYATISPHIITEGVLGFSVIAFIAFWWIMRTWRPEVARFLSARLTWPFRKRARQ
jgi:hypothetical protein